MILIINSFINFDCSRESAVKDLLNRHVTLSTEPFNQEKEHFLQEKLHIPLRWIHYAKVSIFIYPNLSTTEQLLFQ